jgi:hypothetical protein
MRELMSAEKICLSVVTERECGAQREREQPFMVFRKHAHEFWKLDFRDYLPEKDRRGPVDRAAEFPEE